MTVSSITRDLRRKAVWGPKRTFALLITLALGLTPNLFAAGQHANQAHKTKTVQPSARVKTYNLDDELTSRSKKGGSATTRVIVTLQPGADLPPAFKPFSKGRLGLLNGHVLEL